MITPFFEFHSVWQLVPKIPHYKKIHHTFKSNEHEHEDRNPQENSSFTEAKFWVVEPHKSLIEALGVTVGGQLVIMEAFKLRIYFFVIVEYFF